MKYISNAINIGSQNRSSLLIISMVFEIANLDPKLKTSRFDFKIGMCPISIKFGSQNKSNMLIINTLIGIDDLDQKLQICKIWSQK